MKKLIKRGFAALLALTLALGMSVSAFAELRILKLR